ncbi:hypothetical protein RIF29_00444 [Crotalaria pallida]|uniref:Uncharacterized protein n=1 Tax=Crotalaria pallida TaxID=3830 RepID=A0AAN9IVN7_CROPI
MGSPNYSIKVHEHCRITPPVPSVTHSSSLPLTSFDLLWLKFHPAESIFFYSFPTPNTDDYSSYFFDKVVPKLKTSLSLTLQHFLPLTGNIVWPHDSEIPIVKYTPGDEGISLVIAESDADFNHLLDNSSPHEAIESRSFVPHVESSDSIASLISVQVTLIQNGGFCIAFSTHHAFVDGISAVMFIKAWGCISHQVVVGQEESPSLVPELVPFFDRDVIKDTTGRDLFFKYNKEGRSLKILSIFQPKVENSARATFELTCTDIEKLKKMVLFKWDKVVAEEESIITSSKPLYLSSFVVASAYVSVCIAKAIQGVDKDKQKFAFSFMEDCRGRSEPPIPGNYFGNCVWGHFVDSNPMDYTKEDGVIIVAKNIHSKIKILNNKRIREEGYEDVMSKLWALSGDGVNIIAVMGSNRFGMYDIDYGWGRPSKVEMTSVDKGLVFSISDSKGGKGGAEIGLVLNNRVMELFSTFFHAGLLCID